MLVDGSIMYFVNTKRLPDDLFVPFTEVSVK